MRKSLIGPPYKTHYVIALRIFFIKKIYKNHQEIGHLEYIITADELQIIDIFINENFRRQGLAIKTIKKLLASVACSYAILEVRKSNTPAINLYKKLGFQEIDQRKNYYNEPLEDAVVMQLKI